MILIQEMVLLLTVMEVHMWLVISISVALGV